jgi:hypothetical protein
MMVFYVLSRFRAPMIVGMMPLAAYAIVRVLDGVLSKARQGKKVAMRWMIAFAILVLLMARGFLVDHPLIDGGRYRDGVVSHYLPRAKHLHAAGDMVGVVAVWEELFATQPPYVDQVGPGRPIADRWEFDMIEVLVPANKLCLEAAVDGGLRDAVDHYSEITARLTAAVQAYVARHRK